MPDSTPEEDLRRAYRRALWTLVGHGVFVAACVAVAAVARRMFRLPPALLGIALIVALIVFGGDIMRFLRLRDQVRRLDAE